MSIFGVFLVCIFLCSDWIRRNTEYLSIFNPNAEKYGPEKLKIWILFTDWQWNKRNEESFPFIVPGKCLIAGLSLKYKMSPVLQFIKSKKEFERYKNYKMKWWYEMKCGNFKNTTIIYLYNNESIILSNQSLNWMPVFFVTK